MLNVKVRDSTARRGLKQCGLFGRVSRRKFLLSENNSEAHLRFTKLHLNKPADVWNIILWSDETRDQRKPNTSYPL